MHFCAVQQTVNATGCIGSEVWSAWEPISYKCSLQPLVHTPQQQHFKPIASTTECSHAVAHCSCCLSGLAGSFSFPTVPPNAELEYEVELLDWEPVDEVSLWLIVLLGAAFKGGLVSA